MISSALHFRKALRPMRLKFMVSFRHCRLEHCAKVPPTVPCASSRDVYFLQSVAALKGGPIQLKSAGRSIRSIPAPRKQPSGMTRCGSRGSYSALSMSIVLKVPIWKQQ